MFEIDERIDPRMNFTVENISKCPWTINIWKGLILFSTPIDPRYANESSIGESAVFR